MKIALIILKKSLILNEMQLLHIILDMSSNEVLSQVISYRITCLKMSACQTKHNEHLKRVHHISHIPDQSCKSETRKSLCIRVV